MSGTVLVVEGDTPLGRALVRRFRQSGWRVVATFRKTDRAESTEDGPGLTRTPWGRASPVSARNVMLKTLTVHERLDAVVFALTPTLKRVLLHETDYTEMEEALDEWVRGTIFLLHEAIGRMVQQGSGALALVQTDIRDPAIVYPPLEAAIRGALHELGTSLLASYGGEGLAVYRFETDHTGLDEYSKYIVDTITRASPRDRGRTHRYHGRTGLLRRLGLAGRPADRR
jgi:NAD(P)-dependent dehydrogenase (short-subunit alcohol dehydrogenase family)